MSVLDIMITRHFGVTLVVKRTPLEVIRKYLAMHTDRMLYHCTTLQYNHNIWHGSYAEAKF